MIWSHYFINTRLDSLGGVVVVVEVVVVCSREYVMFCLETTGGGSVLYGGLGLNPDPGVAGRLLLTDPLPAGNAVLDA